MRPKIVHGKCYLVESESNKQKNNQLDDTQRVFLRHSIKGCRLISMVTTSKYNKVMQLTNKRFFKCIMINMNDQSILVLMFRTSTKYIYIYIYIYITGSLGRVFANGLEDLGSIPGRVTPKTLKMVLDTSLINTQQYRVRIEGKVEQFWERCSALRTPRCSSY